MAQSPQLCGSAVARVAMWNREWGPQNGSGLNHYARSPFETSSPFSISSQFNQTTVTISLRGSVSMVSSCMFSGLAA